jgi:hypothetical protein
MDRMRATVLVVFATAALAFAGSAAAMQPTTTQQQFHRSIPNFATCPGFAVDGEFEITRTDTIFYDSSGQPIREVLHVEFVGTLTNPLNGKFLLDSGRRVSTFDLVSGTGSSSGSRVDTVPGLGVVFQDTGRLVFDPNGDVIFAAGRHDELDGNLAPLCAYLAG